MDNRYQQYRQTELATANRGKVLLMLYSGAITFLTKAKLYMERKDFENKSRFIIKSLNIIEELNVSLDMQKGQEIAKNLKSIYHFIERYLSQANTENDPKKIEKVIEMLNSLKSAFEEILQNPEHQEAQNINKKEQVESCIKKFV